VPLGGNGRGQQAQLLCGVGFSPAAELAATALLCLSAPADAAEPSLLLARYTRDAAGATICASGPGRSARLATGLVTMEKECNYSKNVQRIR